MKRIFSILLLAAFISTCAFTVNAGSNPIVNRLSAQEVAQCQRPSSIAYNFVIAAMNKDYNRMYSYMSSEGKTSLKYEMSRYDVSSLDELFGLEGKLNIFSWIPALSRGYEVAVTYTYEDYDGCYIYINCVPSSQIDKRGFQDIDTYEDETDVKVVVIWENGWKVNGFK